MNKFPPNVDPSTGEVTAPARKPFAAFLVEQRKGGLAADLADGIAELATAVTETGKAGTLTLTLKVTPNGQGAVKVGDKVVVKPPVQETPEAFFYVAANGDLMRNDPRQPQLPTPVGDDLAERRTGSAS